MLFVLRTPTVMLSNPFSIRGSGYVHRDTFAVHRNAPELDMREMWSLWKLFLSTLCVPKDRPKDQFDFSLLKKNKQRLMTNEQRVISIDANVTKPFQCGLVLIAIHYSIINEKVVWKTTVKHTYNVHLRMVWLKWRLRKCDVRLHENE